MFLMRFTERAYVNYTAEDVKNSPNSAVRLTFSNRHFDPQLGADLYNTYLDEYEYLIIPWFPRGFDSEGLRDYPP